jgi:hypothetical protein
MGPVNSRGSRVVSRVAKVLQGLLELRDLKGQRGLPARLEEPRLRALPEAVVQVLLVQLAAAAAPVRAVPKRAFRAAAVVPAVVP